MGVLGGAARLAAIAAVVAIVGFAPAVLPQGVSELLRDDQPAVCAAPPPPIDVPAGSRAFAIDVASALARAGWPREGRFDIDSNDLLAGTAGTVKGAELRLARVGPMLGRESLTLGIALRGRWRLSRGELPRMYDQCGTNLPVVGASVDPFESIISAAVEHPRAVTTVMVVASPEASQFAPP